MIEPSHATPSRLDNLRSRRYVTSGYVNVFHRAFLYGMGLSAEDMRHPFVGVGVAHNEAVPGQASVRALAEVTRRGLQRAGFTERSFVVPESFQKARTGSKARELVADSAELVVRGHWYDALVGVGASAAACFGLAQALVRLRIPGLVMVPAERVDDDPALAAATATLEKVGLACSVSIEEYGTVRAEGRNVYRSVATGDPGDVQLQRIAEALKGELPSSAFSGAVLGHLSALAHEAGVTDLTDLGAGTLVDLAIDGSTSAPVSALGPVDVVGDWKVVEAASDIIVVANSDTDRKLIILTAEVPALVPARSWPVLLVKSQLELAALLPSAKLRVMTSARTSQILFQTGVFGACVQPGPVESNLNYDRL